MRAVEEDPPFCVHCRASAGLPVVRATYLGAPAGGVPVHHRCLLEFFASLENGAEELTG